MGGNGKDESHEERLDRELIAAPDLQHAVYFGTFCAAIVSTALLMAPTAYHRLRWRRFDKEAMLQISNWLAIGGLVCLALAIGGAAYLIAESPTSCSERQTRRPPDRGRRAARGALVRAPAHL